MRTSAGETARRSKMAGCRTLRPWGISTRKNWKRIIFEWGACVFLHHTWSFRNRIGVRAAYSEITIFSYIKTCQKVYFLPQNIICSGEFIREPDMILNKSLNFFKVTIAKIFPACTKHKCDIKIIWIGREYTPLSSVDEEIENKWKLQVLSSKHFFL